MTQKAKRLVREWAKVSFQSVQHDMITSQRDLKSGLYLHSPICRLGAQNRLKQLKSTLATIAEILEEVK
jgi:hypothetical protein